MVLHTFNKPETLTNNMRFVNHPDYIVLIEDGVYALIQRTDLDQFKNIFAIQADLEARGLETLGHPCTHCNTISYNDLVTMCTEADHIINWF